VDFIIQNWVLILIALASGGMLLWPALTSGGGANSVTPTQAVQLINREKAVVVDVCAPEEFASGHVTNAKNVPIADLETRLTQVVKNKTVPVLMVCASGIRAKRAVATAQKLGYEKAYSLAGGMGAWRAANLPVQKS
jgi:rhodanese-related sulfurtransferase